ncbi:MAG: TetR/AcrR family transcriptional regulator [Paludibacteraceae bacterium]|nr:TetR/AcrR family transcriptional regulator [Paludibacteraceae bacterium]
MNESKEHIITVATKLFLQKSFKEVTMKEIVEETGLSKGAFYHYFQSKEQLFLEVLEFFFTDVMKHAYDRYSKESFYKFYHDYADEMSSFFVNYFEKFKVDESESEFKMNYFSLTFDALKLFPEFRGKMVVGFQQELETWKTSIKNARDRGEIKSPMSDEQVAQLFICLGDGIALHNIILGSNIEKLDLSLWDKLYEQIKV